MQREPYFVRSLEKGGGVVVIDNSNRHYFNQMINVKKVPNLVYLDEKMDIIGTIDVSVQEAEVYVEEKLEDLVKREDALVKREAELMEKEFELAEREQQLNIRENKLNNAKQIVKEDIVQGLGIDRKDLVSSINKVDKRSKEYKDSKKEN